MAESVTPFAGLDRPESGSSPDNSGPTPDTPKAPKPPESASMKTSDYHAASYKMPHGMRKRTT